MAGDSLYTPFARLAHASGNPAAAGSAADRLALVDGNRSLTWRHLDLEVARTVSVLSELGVGRGDRVCWQLPNRIEAALVHLATVRMGAVSVPLVPIYRHREAEFILRQSRSRVFVVPDRFRGFDFEAMARELVPGLPDLAHVLVQGTPRHLPGLQPLIDAASPATTDEDIDPDQPAVILYTSGTTGDPKGVVHTHRTLSNEVDSFIDHLSLDGEDRVLMPSPLTHITGLVFGLHLPAVLGSAGILQEVWNPEQAWSLIEQHACRVMVGATPFLKGLLSSAPPPARRPRLKVFACGGAEVPTHLIREANEQLDCLVTRGYGSSEFPTATLCNADDPVELRAGTDGRPVGDAQVRVVDENGDPVTSGVEGEIQVRGPELFVGYLDSELDGAALTQDGWFRTGDLGTLAVTGHLTVTGRLKDIIIRGGENLSAIEIESLISEHPAVDQVAVVGVPDPVLTERVCAVVVLTPGASLDLESLVGFLAQYRLARQKLPERLEIVPELPRTASGKVQKHHIRARIRTT